MRVSLFTLFFCALLSFPATAQVKTGDKAPDFGQRDLFGALGEVWVSDFVGTEAPAETKKKALLISFSASYCKPCWKELPQLLELKKKYGPKGFEVWTVLVDQEAEGRELGKKRLEKARGKMTITRMAVRRMADVYMGKKWEMPALFLVAGDGKVVSTLKGLDAGGFDKLEKKLSELLSK